MINIINFAIRLAKCIVWVCEPQGYSFDRILNIFSGGTTDIRRLPARLGGKLPGVFTFILGLEAEWEKP